MRYAGWVMGFCFLITNAAIRLPYKVVVCGVCKDVAARVPYSIKIMEKIGDLFFDYRVVVYENNSVDTTLSILKKWEKNNNKVLIINEFLSQQELEKVIINREHDKKLFTPEAIARARNIVLDHVQSERYKEFTHVIWMDMDFVLEPDYEGFVEIFQSDKEWDAVFAYGVCPNNMYWDWYAFRDEHYPIGSELLGNYWWYMPKKLALDSLNEWYPVYSAFGGCGIYKKEALNNCAYSALVTDDLGCFYNAIMRKQADNILVKKYCEELTNNSNIIQISSFDTFYKSILNENTFIMIPEFTSKTLWKMSSFAYKFPSVCEHVTMHSSMILNGYDKLFINPRLIFRYGNP